MDSLPVSGEVLFAAIPVNHMATTLVGGSGTVMLDMPFAEAGVATELASAYEDEDEDVTGEAPAELNDSISSLKEMEWVGGLGSEPSGHECLLSPVAGSKKSRKSLGGCDTEDEAPEDPRFQKPQCS
jgi:hypothetical protein